MMGYKLIDNQQKMRFEISLGDQYAFISYRRSGQSMILLHTEVPSALQGRGIGSQLTKLVLDHALSENLTVSPYCSFIENYIREHPEYSALVLSE